MFLAQRFQSQKNVLISILSDHGKEIIKICRTFKAFILNNLKINEKDLRAPLRIKKVKNDLKMTLF